MAIFNIAISKPDNPALAVTTTLMTIGFGDASTNADMVPFVDGLLSDFKADGTLKGGTLLLIDGPCSLPVGAVIVHSVVHLFANVAIKDVKLNGYVVVTRHGGPHAIGDIIPA